MKKKWKKILKVSTLALMGLSVNSRLRAQDIKTFKATVSAKDMQSLLDLSKRNPSSAFELMTESSTDSVWKMILNMSPSQKSQLMAQLNKIQKERGSLEKHLEKESTQKKAELQTARTQVQNKRIQSDEKSDAILGKALFENFVAEANVKAQSDDNLRQFDESHKITLTLGESGQGQQIVQTIHIGSQRVWNDASANAVAKN